MLGRLQQPAVRLTIKDLIALFLCGMALPYVLCIAFFDSPLYSWLAAKGATAVSPIFRWLHETFDIDWIGYAAWIAFYAIMVLAVQIVIVTRKKIRWESLGFSPFHWKWLAIGTAACAAIWGMYVVIITQLGLADEDRVLFQQSFFPAHLNLATMATLLLIAGPCAAFVEEVYFRGILYRWLRQYAHVVLCVFISAAFFAAIHLYFWEPGGTLGWLITGMIFLIGATFAVLFELSRSLLPSILLHMVWNLTVFTVAFWTF